MARHDVNRDRGFSAAERLGIVVRDWAYAIPQWVWAVLGRARPEPLRDIGERCGVDVVLLPGIWNPWRFQLPLARALQGFGHPVHVVPGLGANGRALADSADVVAEHLARQRLERVVVVAHSKGGLIAKLLLIDPRTREHVLGVVAVGTPFAGSTLARPIRWSSPLRMFRPDSPEVRRLAAETSVNDRIVALSAAWDEMVPNGARLDGARNVTLGEAGHFLPLTSSAVHDMIHGYVHALSEGEPSWK